MVKILGAEIKKSTRKNKKLSATFTENGKTYVIHFGGDPTKSKHFFDKSGLLDKSLNHNDKKIRDAWLARHSKIKLKDGTLAINNKMSPAFWSKNLLW